MDPVQLIVPHRFGDERGWFTEVYSEAAFAARGLSDRYMQDNHSLSRPAGTLQGLRCQNPPPGQAKLVRCTSGAIFDVAVDVRVGSPTFGRWIDATVSAENNPQLCVPIGFARGFLTLEADTEVNYKVTDIYAPRCDGGLIWNDPNIAIVWPLAPSLQPVLSDKDQLLGRLSAFESPFPYFGRPLLPLES